MEQKKTLWIVAAAGIFLLVVIGAALIIYSPSSHNAPVQQASFDPSTGWVNASPSDQGTASQADTVTGQDNEYPGNGFISQIPETEESSNVPAEPVYPDSGNSFANIPDETNTADALPNPQTSQGNANAVINAQNVNVYAQETTTFNLRELKEAAAASQSASVSKEPSVTPQNQKTAEQFEAASSSKQAKAPSQENYYTPSSAPAASTASASAKASKPASSANKTASSSSFSTASKAAAAKSAAAKKVAEVSKTPQNLYWIQVGAYSSKKNADSARAALEEKKIPAEVFTDNKYFKVRAGQYQTKSEAAFWQKEIAKIDKFADSKTMIITSPVQN